MKNKVTSYLKVILFIVILGIMVYYVSVVLRDSGMQLIDVADSIQWPLLAPALLAYFMFYTFSSYAFLQLLNGGEGVIKISASTCFGITNISGLTKYVPGKIWAYTIAYFVLKEHGIALTKYVFNSLVHIILFVVTPFLFMIPVLAFSFLLGMAAYFEWLLLMAGLTIYALCLLFSPDILQLFVSLINRFKKEAIEYCSVTRSDILKTQAWLFIAYFFYIISLVAITYSIDAQHAFLDVLQIAVVCSCSFIVGLTAVFVPGGFGIQEALIYILVGAFNQNSLFVVILMIVFRLVSVSADILVGLFSLWLIRNEVGTIVFKQKS